MIYSLGLALSALFVIVVAIFILTTFPWIMFIAMVLVAWDFAHHALYGTSFLYRKINEHS